MKYFFALAAAAVIALPCYADDFEFGSSPGGSQQLILNGSIVINVNCFACTGWYRETGFHDPANNNYIAGNIVVGSISALFNDYFVFDIPRDITITSAQLSIGNPAFGYSSASPSLLWSLFDVSTPIATLESFDAGDPAGVGIYNDLGGGVLFGSTSVSAATNGAQVLVNLDPAALAALTAAEGHSFAIGGTVSSPSAVPEPSSVILMSTLFFALAFVARKRIGQGASPDIRMNG